MKLSTALLLLCALALADCQNVGDCSSGDPYCQNGGTCIEVTQPDFSIVCECLPGFTGTRCETEQPPVCEPPCEDSRSCSFGQLGDAVCECPESFTGDRCEIPYTFPGVLCFPPNPPCQNGGTCRSFTRFDIAFDLCLCATGFTGNRCETALISTE